MKNETIGTILIALTMAFLMAGCTFLAIEYDEKVKQVKELEYKLEMRERIIEVRTQALQDCSYKLHKLTN